jgi:hypothetical protein
MAKKRGQKLKLSFSRRCMIEFLNVSKEISLNSVSAEKFLELTPLFHARQKCPIKMSWYAIFLKAFAMVSAKYPELRQSYFRFPKPFIYQYHRTVGMLAIEREVDQETMVMYLKIDSPEKNPLLHIDQLIKKSKDCPVDEEPSFRRFLKFNRLPFLLRRLCWWLGMNMPTKKLHYFGTFGLTGLGLGVRSLSVKSPLPISFVFDMSQTEQKPLVRLFWDHRIFDGIVVISFFKELEKILNVDIVSELNELSKSTSQVVEVV